MLQVMDIKRSKAGAGSLMLVKSGCFTQASPIRSTSSTHGGSILKLHAFQNLPTKVQRSLSLQRISRLWICMRPQRGTLWISVLSQRVLDLCHPEKGAECLSEFSETSALSVSACGGLGGSGTSQVLTLEAGSSDRPLHYPEKETQCSLVLDTSSYQCLLCHAQMED